MNVGCQHRQISMAKVTRASTLSSRQQYENLMTILDGSLSLYLHSMAVVPQQFYRKVYCYLRCQP
jgi:hypothetical protein